MRIFGLDIGKVSFSAVWYEGQNGEWQIKDTFWEVHQQKVDKVWQGLKTKWQIKEDDLVVTTGRFRGMLPFPGIVDAVAQKEAVKFLYPNQDITVIRIGGGGFSIRGVKNSSPGYFKENHRCAAGVGSFLDQIVSRLGFENIVQADKAARDVKGLEISSRCGVTMKTDATHLANTGFPKEEIIAGLLDSSAKNAAVLALRNKISSQVLIIGGLSNLERIVKTFKESLASEIKVEVPPQAQYFEALGAALIGKKMTEDKDFKLPENQISESPLVFLPGLRDSLDSVTKIKNPLSGESSLTDSLIMGLDIGSTGSKLVIFNQEPIFEAYGETKGQPVEAAKELIKKVPQEFLNQIRAVGCTGSGRYTVAESLMASLPEENRWRIFVLNEIAAHAEGAHYYDKDVDTVVDIGGQDAKFTKLESGRVIDSCMNTVCSAGTGSFLAEQLQLLGIKDIKKLGRIALESPRAVDLGQHCAVFISEQIDEANRKGAQLSEIVSGLYYSVVQNYNNRVKGFRDYGKKVFLQGKPAENLALACALAKVTGNQIIVPPSPGTPGALGIDLLTKKELDGRLAGKSPLSLDSFLESEILEKKEFRCQSKDGCKEGNLCSIKMITVKLGQKKIKFFWGGDCDKYEKKPGKDLALTKAPHPFIEREKLILGFVKQKTDNLVRSVGIPRGLETEEILPLAVTFFQELGFEVDLQESLSLKYLEEGAKLCQATFCAPVQLLGGQAKLQENCDFIFLPKITEISGQIANPEEKRCFVCPLSQAIPDFFSPRLTTKVLEPFLNFKLGYEKNKKEFLKLGAELGCSRKVTSLAFEKAVKAQKEFEDGCRKIGEKALEFARKNNSPVVVVLGHPYIINSSLLSAGIPEAIQENGAIALPVDCYSLDNNNHLFQGMYWGYGQRLLQATWQIRRQPGIYPLWLSVYSCGPDSFLLHFFQYLTQGKPYTILESDAYTGQAGFKTRVESFLYGIKNYKPHKNEPLTDFQHFNNHESLAQIRASKRKVLAPWMGESSRILTAFFNSIGIESETLPLGDQKNLEFGRKFTSGKECLPMIITLGGLLKYLDAHPQDDFYYFMPQAGGPCRFGQYQLLFKIVLEKLGLAERVKIISPTSETGYQYQLQVGPASTAKAWSAIVFTDLLKDALYDIRPEEKIPGITQKVFDLYLEKAEKIVSKKNNNWSGLKDLWGLKSLAEIAASHFQEIPRDPKKQDKPTVLVTGEIYVRLDSFANNEVIKELEGFGVKAKLSPFREWVNYVTWTRLKRETLVKANWLKIRLTTFLQRKIERDLYQIFAQALGWSEDHHVEEILETARPYLSGLKPLGEAALTIGLPLLLWQKKEIAGVLIVGPFECMPTRIGENQLNLISQKTGLPVLTLAFYGGEPLERDILETFIWDLKN